MTKLHPSIDIDKVAARIGDPGTFGERQEDESIVRWGARLLGDYINGIVMPLQKKLDESEQKLAELRNVVRAYDVAINAMPREMVVRFSHLTPPAYCSASADKQRIAELEQLVDELRGEVM